MRNRICGRNPDPVAATLIQRSRVPRHHGPPSGGSRRHIVDAVRRLPASIRTRLNFEMANTLEIVALVWISTGCRLVPERREEVTTEGGLDVVIGRRSLTESCAHQFQDAGIAVSLFVAGSGEIEASRQAPSTSGSTPAALPRQGFANHPSGRRNSLDWPQPPGRRTPGAPSTQATA